MTYTALHNEEDGTFSFSFSLKIDDTKKLFVLPIYLKNIDPISTELLMVTDIILSHQVKQEAEQSGKHIALLFLSALLCCIVYKRIYEI